MADFCRHFVSLQNHVELDILNTVKPIILEKILTSGASLQVLVLVCRSCVEDYQVHKCFINIFITKIFMICFLCKL